MLPAHFKSKPPHFLAPKGTGSLAAAASPRPACPPRSHSSCRGSLPQVFAFWHRCAASHSKSLLKRRRRPPMLLVVAYLHVVFPVQGFSGRLVRSPLTTALGL